MKNLKRTLSLVLSAAMMVGMMAIGTSAKFADVAGNDHEDAIEVMNLLGIMTGDDKGNFNPDNVVTRNEMAVVMVNLLDLKLNGSHPFTDVADWADKYVGAIYTNGYTAGKSATLYGGTDKITTAEAALMIMKTLGYFEFQGEFGDDWKLATVKRATELKLFDDIDAGINDYLTRGEVAEMVLAVLDEEVKIAREEGGMTVSGNGITVTEKPTYEYAKAYDELYDKLFDKALTVNENATDKFGRPATSYTFDGDTVTVADEPLAVYAGSDFDKDTMDDNFEDWTITYDISYNGDLGDTVTKADLEASRKGYTIEVFGDADDEIVSKFVVIEAYAAMVTNINTNDDDEITDVDIEVYEAAAGTVALNIDVEDDEDAYALVKDLEEDEVFAITLASDWEVAGKDVDKTILAVDEVETVEGKVTTISVTSGYNGWVKIDGVKYSFAWEYSQVPVAKEADGAFYLYNGYVIHFDGSVGEADTEYLYVTRQGSKAADFGGMDYYCEVVYADGTAEVIDTKEAYADGVYAYEFDEDEEYYVLTKTAEIANAGTQTITKGNTVAGGKTANAKTEYIAITLKDDKDSLKSVSTYVGYKNVATMTGGTVWTVAEAGKAASLVFVVSGTVTTSGTDMIYVAGESVSNKIEDADLGDFYTFNAIVDGEIVEIMATANTYNGLYSAAAQNSDDVYTSLTAAAAGDYTTVAGEFKKAADEVITIAGSAMAYTDDVVVYVIDTDGDIVKGSIARNYSNGSDYTLSLTYTTNDDGEVDSLYIVKVAK